MKNYSMNRDLSYLLQRVPSERTRKRTGKGWPPKPVNIPTEVIKHGPSKVPKSKFDDPYDCGQCRLKGKLCKLHSEIESSR